MAFPIGIAIAGLALAAVGTVGQFVMQSKAAKEAKKAARGERNRSNIRRMAEIYRRRAMVENASAGITTSVNNATAGLAGRQAGDLNPMAEANAFGRSAERIAGYGQTSNMFGAIGQIGGTMFGVGAQEGAFSGRGNKPPTSPQIATTAYGTAYDPYSTPGGFR